MIVTKSEAIVKGRYSLNPVALKFVTTLIAGMKKSDNVNKYYYIRVKDFSELMGVKRKDIYWAVKNALKELLEKPLFIPNGKTEYDNSFLMMNWVASAEYKEGDGLVEFEISKKLRPYLLEVKEKFLKYKLENILTLKSSYSIRMYEILKDWYEINKRYSKKTEKIINIQELRDMLEIPKSYPYGGSSGIKNRIIIKSQKEISEHTDIKFSFEEIKTGRKITHLKFTIVSTEQKKDIKKVITNKNPTPNDIREYLNGEKRLIIDDDYYYTEHKLLFKNGTFLNNEQALLEYSYISNNWNKAKILSKEEFQEKNKNETAKKLLEAYKNQILRMFPVKPDENDYRNLELLDIFDFEDLNNFKIIVKDENDNKFKFKKCSLNTLKLYTN